MNQHASTTGKRARWPLLRPGPRPVVDETWMTEGACTPEVAGADWDPYRHTDPRRADEAKAVCTSCPVQAACLKYATQVHVTDGVWGGKAFFQRSWGKAAA